MDYIVITPNTDTFANPTMVSIFERVEQEEGRVYLFGPKQQAGCPENIHCVEQHVCDFRLEPWRNPKRYLSQWRSYRQMAKYVEALGVKVAMVVDPMGVVAGGRLCKYFCKGLRLSYLSFEIFFRDELKGYYRKMKDKEIDYSRYISSVLSQDENRYRLLCEENGLAVEMPHSLVPVSTAPMNIAHPVDIHERMGIGQDMKTVVYSGSIGTWCGTEAILDMFEQGWWPKGYHLVFHTRKPLAVVEVKEDGANGAKTIEERLVALDKNENIPFTLHAHPFDSFNDLGAFLKGFDMALALYYPNTESPYYGKNMQEIGLSSGKFSMYMMLGLPTIVTPCRTYAQLIEKYQFGAVLESAREIEESLAQIDEHSSREAKRLYDEVLQPEVEEYIKMIVR